jgi:hypothetical protein
LCSRQSARFRARLIRNLLSTAHIALTAGPIHPNVSMLTIVPQSN